MRLWENPNGIPNVDISWLKEDTERGLFTPVQIYKDNTGLFKRRRVMKSDRMWFYPPEPPGCVGGALLTPQLFSRSCVFVWCPVGVWRYSLKCPRGDECVGRGRKVHLYKFGYHSRVQLTSPVLDLLHYSRRFITMYVNMQEKRTQKVIGLCSFFPHMYFRYVTPVMCPAGTQRSLMSCAADHAQKQQGAEKVAPLVVGLHGIPLIYLNLARRIKLCSLPSSPASE